ncbi:TolC family protein, partial [Klebsiella pneumoniae]
MFTQPQAAPVAPPVAAPRAQPAPAPAPSPAPAPAAPIAPPPVQPVQGGGFLTEEQRQPEPRQTNPLLKSVRTFNPQQPAPVPVNEAEVKAQSEFSYV